MYIIRLYKLDSGELTRYVRMVTDNYVSCTGKWELRLWHPTMNCTLIKDLWTLCHARVCA